MNETFASALSVVGQKGLLALSDLAAAACTCKDSQATIGTVMHEFSLSNDGSSGPLYFELALPQECCTTCKNAWTDLRWPMHPHQGLAICLRCLGLGLHRSLDCLTTTEAQQKYQIKDLSSLQWTSHPLGAVQTRYYREYDVRVLAIRERGGPVGFNKGEKARQTKVIMQQRKRLVKHYEDPAKLKRCFQTQAMLAGLNLADCIDLRASLECPEEQTERVFRGSDTTAITSSSNVSTRVSKGILDRIRLYVFCQSKVQY